MDFPYFVRDFYAYHNFLINSDNYKLLIKHARQKYNEMAIPLVFCVRCITFSIAAV